MEEELNLVEILQDCPQGTKLYSTIFGWVDFEYIENEEIIVTNNISGDTEYHKVVDINMDLLVTLYLYFKASYERLVSIHKLNLDKRAEAASDAAALYVWMELE